MKNWVPVSLILEYGWPVLVVILGALLSLILNTLVEREKELEDEVMTPLIEELNSLITPSQGLDESVIMSSEGEFDSVVSSMDQMKVIRLNSKTDGEIMEYLRALGQYEIFQGEYYLHGRILEKSGYGEHFRNHLDNDLFLEASDRHNSTEEPGPLIKITQNIVPQDSTGVFNEEMLAPIKSDQAVPLFVFLLANYDKLVSCSGPDELRGVFERDEVASTAFLDSKDNSWCEDLWKALSSEWSPPEREGIEIESVDEPITYDPISGGDFESVVSEADMTAMAHRNTLENQLRDVADALRAELITRTRQNPYHPRRLLS